MRRVSRLPKGATALVCLVTLLIGGLSAWGQEPVFQPVNADGLLPIEFSGFGDPGNTRAAAMTWFKGRLYVATERWTHCVFASVLARRYRLPVYPPTPDCAPDPNDLTLAAEIWRYSPLDGSWELVFTSPENVPVAIDPVTGIPTKFIARDIAISSLAVVTERNGTEALYAGGRTYAGKLGLNTSYPPRLLRTVDGSAWAPVPQAPGTFLGELGRPLPGSGLVTTGFDQLVAIDGKLVALLTTGLGNGVEGMLIASDDPAAGNGAWHAASPPPEEFPITGVTVFDGRLYVGVDAPRGAMDYAVYRSDAGAAPFSFTPVIESDPDAEPRDDRGWIVSFAVHNGSLYAGAGWPLEVVRIEPDDSWELLVGGRRMSPEGDLIAPVSGISAGFGNVLDAQGVTMASDGTSLYLGTLDASLLALLAPSLAARFQHELGFDLFRTEDGVYWYPVSKVGLGVFTQFGLSSMATTPMGLVAGTLGVGGAQVWLKGAAPSPTDAGAGAPFRVEAAAEALAGDEAILSWEPVPGALVYHVYRSEVTPLLEALGGGAGTGADFLANLDADALLCQVAPGLCRTIEFFRDDVGLPGPYEWVGSTTDLYYVEPPPTSLQSMYFVRAELPDGSISGASNFVGAVSTAVPVTFPVVVAELERRFQNDELGVGALRALTMVRRAAHSARGGNLAAARRMLALGEGILTAQRGTSLSETVADDLCLFIYRLRRNVQLAEWLLVSPSSLL